MNDYKYYDRNGVRISMSELIIKGTSYPLQKIISCRIAETNKLPKYGALFMFIGVLLLVDEGSLFILGGGLFLIGVLMCFSVNPSFSLRLLTSDGEKSVLNSNHIMEIDDVMQALDKAIAYNGNHIEITRLSSI